MTREQWLEQCWCDLRDELAKVRAEKDRRGGQHVPCMSALLGVSHGAMLDLERRCRDALETSVDWYGDKETKEDT